MESSLSPCGMSSARISTHASTGSLDIELLIDTPLMHSIMSESITVCSLPSVPSGDLPTFGIRKPPTWRMIGLGDRLKMFSSPEGTHTKDRRKNSHGSVSISIPTSPRLRTMLKECLSISKWAESSTAWQPPGHVPWESAYDSTVSPWVPEGSIFSPECFSIALLRSRNSHRGIQSRTNTHILSSSISPIFASSPTPPASFADQDSIDAELLSMLNELRSVRPFFQSSESGLDGHALETLSLPSLVISNSDFTFPMSLESSSSITPARSNSLASRRGKKTPPTLVLRKERSTADLSYPGIPSAFLGSPSHYTPTFEEANKEEKPSLEFEDMINNLRLQCSTMALQTPPSDTTLNSRASPVLEGSKKVKNEFANNVIKEHKSPVQQAPRPVVERTHRRANSYGTRIAKKPSHAAGVPTNRIPITSREKQATPPKTTNPCKTRPRPVALSKVTVPSKADEKQSAVPTTKSLEGVGSGSSSMTAVPRTTCPPETLRSAIVKFDSSRTLKSSKSVRFILPSQDLAKEVHTSCFTKEVASKEEQPLLSNVPSTGTSTDLVHQTEPKVTCGQSPAITLSRKSSKIARALVTTTPSRSQVREEDCAAALTTILPPSPPRQILTSSLASEDLKSNLTKSSSRMSVQSIGRHSLNRIMKGPLFTSKDKRATLSSIPCVQINDENTARREAESVPPISKKSRMPVPLRNIFTRFK